jgi:phage shock protein A
MDSLWPLLIPILASTLILVVGAFTVRRYSGPALAASQQAQSAYIGAVEARMKVLVSERDDLTVTLGRMTNEIAALRVNVAALEGSVRDLERQIRDLTVENLRLLRQRDEARQS